jgi:ornithine cyclodeaminase/alanine dehydrogenase
MSELIYLTRHEVAELLPPLVDQLELVEETYRALAAGEVELPPKPGIHPRPNAFIHAMPAYLEHEDVAALKWIAGYRSNKQRGLPYLNGLIVLNDPETGLPTAIMDAAEITATRTAVASGVCVRRWAPAGWTTAAIVGFGVQGRRHAEVLRLLNENASIRAYDPKPERIAAADGDLRASATPREAVEGAEVVVTAAPMTEDRRPELDVDWLGERYLLVPVDFDSSMTPAAIGSAELFLVDDVGQFEYYRGLGHFDRWPQPDGSVGEGLRSARTVERTACVNLGIGALDAVFAKRVLDAARAREVGRRLPL